jgi:hypothetical protein
MSCSNVPRSASQAAARPKKLGKSSVFALRKSDCLSSAFDSNKLVSFWYREPHGVDFYFQSEKHRPNGIGGRCHLPVRSLVFGICARDDSLHWNIEHRVSEVRVRDESFSNAPLCCRFATASDKLVARSSTMDTTSTLLSRS